MSLATDLAKLQQQARGNRPSILEFNQEIDPKLVQMMDDYAATTKPLLELSMVTPTNSAKVKGDYIGAWKAGRRPKAPRLNKNIPMLLQVIKLEGTIRSFLSCSWREFKTFPEQLICCDFGRGVCRDLQKVELAKVIVSGKIAQRKHIVESLYGKLDDELLRKAQHRHAVLVEIAKNPYYKPETVLDDEQIDLLSGTMAGADEFAEAFSLVCKEFDFPGGVEMRILGTISRMNVETRARTRDSFAQIPADRFFSWAKNLQTLVHESWHLVANFNRHFLTSGRGGGEFNEALTTGAEYEFARDYFGLLRVAEEKCYYVFAVEAALNGGGFNEVYETVLGLMLDANEQNPYEQAWVATERTLRGLTDYSKNPAGYAHTKALSYFSGQMLYEDFKEADVLYFLEAGISDPDMMRLLAERYYWHEGCDILAYDGGVSYAVSKYLHDVLLPRLEKR